MYDSDWLFTTEIGNDGRRRIVADMIYNTTFNLDIAIEANMEHYNTNLVSKSLVSAREDPEEIQSPRFGAFKRPCSEMLLLSSSGTVNLSPRKVDFDYDCSHSNSSKNRTIKESFRTSDLTVLRNSEADSIRSGLDDQEEQFISVLDILKQMLGIESITFSEATLALIEWGTGWEAYICNGTWLIKV